MQNSISEFIDHTVLGSSASKQMIEKCCEEAIMFEFKTVCVPPYYVSFAKKCLQGSKVLVCTVIGFPMGYACTASKLAEIKQALIDGADELDIVQNIAAVKNSDWDFIKREIALCLQPIRLAEKIVKVILESGSLTDEEIKKCCEIYAKRKVDFVKTSTGFVEKGASLEAVRLMRANLPMEIQIKASGGIRNLSDFKAYLEAGATRIGTSSGLKILEEAENI